MVNFKSTASYAKLFSYCCIPRLVNVNHESLQVSWNCCMVKFCSYHASTKSEKTVLVLDLISQIKARGAISLADYMRQVLAGPIGGYYMKSDVFGTDGDFITSPEVNQMFGELVGIWLYYQWMQADPQSQTQIVELGPGRGTLSADVLRTINQFRALKDGLSLHLVEISPRLSEIQEETICVIDDKSAKIAKELKLKSSTCYKAGISKDGVPVYWHSRLEDVPNGYSLIIANEFFDALPVHQFSKVNGEWKEVMIEVDEGAGPHHLKFVLSSKETIESKLYTQNVTFIEGLQTNSVIETSPESISVVQEIAHRIEANRGCALIIDYGDYGTGNDTIRAFRKHKQVHVLDAPGTADITADVNFASFNQCINDRVKFYRPIPQGLFLTQMGIRERLQNLLKNCPPKHKAELMSAYNFLVHPKEMGLRFKVACMVHSESIRPPVF